MFDESEEERVRRAIIDTVVDNYDLIAQSQEANRRVETMSGTAQAEADKLRESLIKLQAQSKTVMHAGSVWRQRKQILSNAVAQHQKLLALAEAPSLVEECIRGEMYHEALLVMEHTLRSNRYAQQGVQFFVRVNQQIREALERGLEEVVMPRLSGPLSLDAAFKIATFLRRLGTSNERLRVLFLERRSLYIDRLVAEADSSPAAYSRMLKHVNIYKVHVSEVIMQYCACFPAAPGSAAAVAASTGDDAVDAWDSSLQAWCHAQAERFVNAFGAIIGEMANGSELALVIEQCGGCSSSVSKLHADVAPLLNELIISRVKEIFAEHMAHALNAYAASMRTFSWRLPPSYTGSGAAGTHGAAAADLAGGVPLVLAQWLPLAYALNGLLTAFNAVRKCLVAGVEVFCGQQVEALLGRIASDLLRDGELASTMEEAERGVYADLVTVFVNVFYPHVIGCTRKLLGVEVARWLEAGLSDVMDMLSSRLPAPAPANTAEPTAVDNAAMPPQHQSYDTAGSPDEQLTTQALSSAPTSAPADGPAPAASTPSYPVHQVQASAVAASAQPAHTIHTPAPVAPATAPAPTSAFAPSPITVSSPPVAQQQPVTRPMHNPFAVPSQSQRSLEQIPQPHPAAHTQNAYQGVAPP